MTNWDKLHSDYLELLRDSEIVAGIVSTSARTVGTRVFVLKVRFQLVNGWLVGCWEKIAFDERRYSYHVFRENRAITRWDNAPHHAHLDNFPHHRHVSGTILPSEEMDVARVLAQLEAMM